MRETTLWTITLLLAVVTPARALERHAVPMDREGPTPWDAGASCVVTYANVCTGWLWTWDEFEELDRVGVIFEPCCGDGRLVSTQAYFWTGSPTGWGFTGVLSVAPVVAGCPGPPYHSYPVLPPTGPIVDEWSDIPPGPAVLMFTYYGDYAWNVPPPASVPTDHPAAGPTGPQSCGLCFPSTRTIHTFRFGSADSPLCPGSPFNDGTCDAEAFYWSAKFSCAVAAEPTTWGALKNLYR